MIREALLTPVPRAKLMAARRIGREWRAGRLVFTFPEPMPTRPAHPSHPELLAPSRMPRRGRGFSPAGRIALWHALAHIEFVAIDLALDMAGRFGAAMGEDFVTDFLAVAADEAMHFALIARHLAKMGSHYGALPAHDGLWQAAEETAHDVAARLAVVPMVLEARGLDVTPDTLRRVRDSGDMAGAKILTRILSDEIQHVRLGVTHFTALAAARGESVENMWRTLVKRHYRGTLKRPFNVSARESAGLSRQFTDQLA